MVYTYVYIYILYNNIYIYTIYIYMHTAILGKMLEYILSSQTNTSDPWDGRRSTSMGHIRIVSESKSEDAGNFQQDMAGSSELVLIRESASCEVKIPNSRAEATTDVKSA